MSIFVLLGERQFDAGQWFHFLKMCHAKLDDFFVMLVAFTAHEPPHRPPVFKHGQGVSSVTDIMPHRFLHSARARVPSVAKSTITRDNALMIIANNAKTTRKSMNILPPVFKDLRLYPQYNTRLSALADRGKTHEYCTQDVKRAIYRHSRATRLPILGRNALVIYSLLLHSHPTTPKVGLKKVVEFEHTKQFLLDNIQLDNIQEVVPSLSV